MLARLGSSQLGRSDGCASPQKQRTPLRMPSSKARVRPPAGDEPPLGTSGKPYSPLIVAGDMCGDGLGLTSWWEAAAEDGDAAMADG